jgi:type IX secretion system PorP/SprF family membrane protein
VFFLPIKNWVLSIESDKLNYIMRRLILLIIVFTGIFINYSYSQVDSHFSLFEYSQNIYNPGAAGSNNAMCVTSLHRQQWVGWPEGRPQTTLFSFDMPLADVLGVGLNINQDILGFQQDLNISANVAYRVELDPGMLGVGIGIGVINRAIDGNWITWQSLTGGTVYQDPAVPHMDNKIAFDMNFGATLVGDDFWIGISTTHLLRPTINFEVELPSYISRHYYLVGGYNYSLPNPSFDLVGTGMVLSDGSTVEFQVNAKILYNKSFWGGLSYRYNDAIVPMIGVHLINGLSIGYSYDIVTSKVGSYNSGSHELMVRYCFNLKGGKTPGRYRSVRRL